MDSDLLKIEDYGPTLKHHHGKYHFIAFELSLVSTGSTPGEAYDDLRKKYNDLVRDLKNVGAEKTLPPPQQEMASWYAPVGGGRAGITGEIATFLIKMVIFFALLGAAAAAGGSQLKHSLAGIKSSLRQLDKTALRPLYSLENLAAKAEQVPDEKLDQIQQNLRTIVTRVAPLATELQPLTAAICAPPPTTNKTD